MPRRRLIRLALGAAIVAVVASVVATFVMHRSSTPPPVDDELAAQIRAIGVRPYVVELEGATLADVEAEDDVVWLYYDHGYFEHEDRAFNDANDYTFSVAIYKAPSGDLCGRRGSGPLKHGGSCTSRGDRSSSEFEDMGSFTERKGDTAVTIHTTIDMDDDIGRKAFAALDQASRVSVDELARHGDRDIKRF